MEKEFEAAICWFSETPMQVREKHVLKHTTREVKAMVADLRYRIDVNTLHRDEEATGLDMNEIGGCIVRTTQPLCIDEYNLNRNMGSSIRIDPRTNNTAGAGMIWRRSVDPPEPDPFAWWTGSGPGPPPGP